MMGNIFGLWWMCGQRLTLNGGGSYSSAFMGDVAGILVVFLFDLLVSKFLPKTPMWKKLVLSTTLGSDAALKIICRIRGCNQLIGKQGNLFQNCIQVAK